MILIITLPIIITIAFLIIINILNRTLEINILKASGLSNFKIAKPFILVSICFSIIAYIFAIWLNPNANKEFTYIEEELIEEINPTLIRENIIENRFRYTAIYYKERVQ